MTEYLADEFERKFVQPNPGRVLLVGSRVYVGREDRRLLHENAFGVDMLNGPGVDKVIDMEGDVADLGMFDHIECLSVLEHAKRPWRISKNLQRLMNPGATIYLTVPFVWRLHSYPGDYWRFSIEAVRLLFPQVNWAALVYGHQKLQEGGKVPAVNIDGYPHFARCEVYGFGTLAP